MDTLNLEKKIQLNNVFFELCHYIVMRLQAGAPSLRS
jgi:hypothetical protein